MIAELGCIVGPSTHCAGRTTIHHCGTGAGGRKDHDKVIGLCWGHHLGPEGIDGQRMSKRAWQAKYGQETALLEKTNGLLNKQPLMPIYSFPAPAISELEELNQIMADKIAKAFRIRGLSNV